MADWHCNINGKQYGPITGEEVGLWIRDGRVGPLDMVWCEGMGAWAPANSIPEFMGLFAQSTQPPPIIDDDYDYPEERRYMRPHRGGTVLTLGILGLVVCCICGIIAWSMGNSDLREMAAGRMDPSGEDSTKAGKICGMISVILNIVVAVFYLLAIGAAASR